MTKSRKPRLTLKNLGYVTSLISVVATFVLYERAQEAEMRRHAELQLAAVSAETRALFELHHGALLHIDAQWTLDRRALQDKVDKLEGEVSDLTAQNARLQAIVDLLSGREEK